MLPVWRSPVESMVNVPAQYRHLHKGTFILTTVISHAPILAGEWVVARIRSGNGDPSA